MKILPITQKDKDAYNTFVASNNGSFLQSFEWGEWQTSNNRQALRYLVQDDDTGDTVLSAQFIRHPLPFGQYYLYCPYGPVVNCKLQIANCKLAIQELIQKIQKDFPKTIFVRLEPTYNLPFGPELRVEGQLTTYNLVPTLHIQPGSTILLDITKSNDELLTAMHPKTRYNIKVAEKHGVTIKKLQSQEEKQLVASMLKGTLTRRNLVSPSTDYYYKLANYNTDDKNFTVNTFGAYLGDTLLACALTIDVNQTRTYLFGGSTTEHKNLMAPYLLHWQIIQDAKTFGLTTYDWFGAEGAVSDGSGFARFKSGFGGTVLQYGGAWDIVLKPLAYRTYRATRHLNRWLKHR